MGRREDNQSVHEWVEAQRKAGDPRVAEYDRTRARARSDAARQGAATRRAAKTAKKAPAKKAPKAAKHRASDPVSGTPRVKLGGPVKWGTPTFGPVSAPTVSMPSVPPTRVGPPPAVKLVPPPAVTPPAAGRVRRRRGGGGLTPGQAQAAAAGQQVANRHQTSQLLGGKPSTTKSAVAGAAGGAATGAAVGSVVPGPGTGIGAGVGAVLGGAGGAAAGSRRKREYKRAMAAAPGARRILVAEFTVCMLIVALSPLTDRHKADTPGAWMKRMAALMGVFLVLALLSAMGRGPARVAAGFGGLVAVVLAVSGRDLFVKVADIFGGVPQTEAPSTGGEAGVTPQRQTETPGRSGETRFA